MTAEQLEVEFKKFGPIKPGGIQVRNNKVGIRCIKCIEYILSSAFPDMVLSPPWPLLGALGLCSSRDTVLALLNFSHLAP